MLENYYVRPITIDRIRVFLIAPAIEQVRRLASAAAIHLAQRASPRSHPGELRRVARSARCERTGHSRSRRTVRGGTDLPGAPAAKAPRGARRPARRCATLFVRCCVRPSPGYIGLVRPHKPADPFERQAPRFLTHRRGRDCAPRSMLHYRYHLHQFATYLQRIGIDRIRRRCRRWCQWFHRRGPGRHGLPGRRRDACGTLRVLCATSIVKE